VRMRDRLVVERRYAGMRSPSRCSVVRFEAGVVRPLAYPFAQREHGALTAARRRRLPANRATAICSGYRKHAHPVDATGCALCSS
jgi:hypothetical protein